MRIAPMSVRSGPAQLPVVPDPVAAEALCLEDCPPARRVAEPHGWRIRVGAGPAAHEGDQPAHLVRGQSEGRHTSARDAGRHECCQRLICCRTRQPPAPQVDAADAHAGRAMAAGAIGRIDARAGGDVGGGILARVVLSGRSRANHHRYDDRDPNELAVH